jgi:hypothetical protein
MIAQRFIAGQVSQQGFRPGGTDEKVEGSALGSFVPTGR